MTVPSLLARLRLRFAALPRTPRELDRGLRLWAAYRRLGWFASGAHGARLGKGEPVPWWTYPARLWLADHLAALPAAPGACLELGAGSSTSWLARRFERVVSVEHDERWFQRVRAERPRNVEIRRVDAADLDGYLAAFGEREHWDLVVVDGLHRAAALARAVAQLDDRGLALLATRIGRSTPPLSPKPGVGAWSAPTSMGSRPGRVMRRGSAASGQSSSGTR